MGIRFNRSSNAGNMRRLKLDIKGTFGNRILAGRGAGGGTSVPGETAADILAKLLTVDGADSLLDADLLDGAEGALYARLESPTFSGIVTIPSLIVTDLTDGYVPYRIAATDKLGNSPIFTDGTNVGIGVAAPLAKQEIMGSPGNSTPEAILDLSRPYQYGYAYTSAASFKLSNPNVGVINTRLDIALLQADTTVDTLPDTVVMSLLSNGNVGIGIAAPSVALQVAGTGIKSEIVQSVTAYSTGFFGDGYKVIETGGETTAEFDNLIVRKLMKVYELEVNKISAIGGRLIVSPASGKVTAITDYGNYVDLFFDTKHGANPIQFVAGDYIAAQLFDGAGTSSFRGYVSSVRQYGEGESISVDKISGTPWISMDLVSLGSSVAARSNFISLSAIDTNNPYIEGHAGVTTGIFDDTTRKFRLGNLTGITDSLMGALDGFGSYWDNAYLRGRMVLPNAGMTNEGALASSIRIYAGTSYADKAKAPFRVTQDGTVIIYDPQPHWNPKIASVNLKHSHDAEVTTTSGGTVLLKTITFTNGLKGVQRFKFTMRNSDDSTPVFARIYRNGAPLGTPQEETSISWVTKSEDITQTWSPGDTCELRGNVGGIATLYVVDFRVYYDEGPMVLPVASTYS